MKSSNFKMCKKFIAIKFILFVLCILPFTSNAQYIKDSLLGLTKSETGKKAIFGTDTTFNALLKRVDYYADQFNSINIELNNGFDTLDISESLPVIEARLIDIQKYPLRNNFLTLRSLSTFQDYFATSQKQLNKWDSQLSAYNTTLIGMQEVLCSLTTDSVFKSLPADSALRERFFSRLNALGPKWHRLDSLSTNAIQSIGILQSRVSAAQLELVDFNDQISQGLKNLKSRTFAKEYPYLWQISFKNIFTELELGISKTIRFNTKILLYYLKYSYKVHLINFFLFLLLFIWLSKNRNIILKENQTAVSIFKHAVLISKYPVIGALTVTCTIGPFFYYHPPIILSQLYLMLLILCLAALVKRAYKDYFYAWLCLVVFVAIYSISNLFFEVYPSERILFFLVNILLLLSSYWFYAKNKIAIKELFKSNISYLVFIYFGLIILGLFANLFGRYSLSKTAITTAVFTLVEGISLVLFVQIITEGIYLQMEVGKIQISKLSSYLDFKNLKNRIGKVLKFVAILLLIIFFTQNLNIFDSIYDSSKSFFVEQREIGDTKFTFAGFLLFILIIYLATVIARVVSYFFEFADQHAAKTTRRGKYSSSILLVRLSIWIVGFLIAIAASGIPMDKLTIILGALGVGIGFGLQNIVNNVVSGLVMVFEKPVQVGDLIEVGNKTGTVRSMGLRASKILTLEGSEVIVPNGDLLSQNLINWTLSNTHKRISIDVGVAYGTDIDKVKDIFKNILEQNEDVMKNPPALVLLNDFGDSAVNFKLLCWVADIDRWLIVKSVLMSDIFEVFYKQGISIPFPQRDVHVYLKDSGVVDLVNKNEPAKQPLKPLKED